jgi:hypothetical protein
LLRGLKTGKKLDRYRETFDAVLEQDSQNQTGEAGTGTQIRPG